ncbi:MAG TPA: DUF3467 domain-containing protein [Anaerolineaceae bacterium]|nr:DUF3467 domain-containing protein [Anaerolineaceae bacterium]HQH84699.1 DUF3467 domain-containing protein [Anaerolineaceae bacterium]HQN42883.1 DUF3467 domain-containing protein [Anaerolineaceae bacterium]
MTHPPTPPGLELPPDLEPLYSNLARISHTPAEFVIDFARLLPGQTSLNVSTRLVMSPVSLKLFLRAMVENLARYEASFGEIKLPGDTSLATDLFRNIQPPPPPPAPE